MNRVINFLKILLVILLFLSSCKKEKNFSEGVEIKNITLSINSTNYTYSNIGDTIQIFIPAGIIAPKVTLTDIELSNGANSYPKKGDAIPTSLGIGSIKVTAQDGKTTKNYVIKIEHFPYNSTLISALTLTINNINYNASIGKDTAMVTIPFDGTMSDVIIKSIIIADSAKSSLSQNDTLHLVKNIGFIDIIAQDGKTQKTYVIKIMLNFSSSYITCDLQNLTIIKNFKSGYISQLDLKYPLSTTMKFYRNDNSYGICKAQMQEFSLYVGASTASSSLSWTGENMVRLTPTNLTSNTTYRVFLKIKYLEQQGDQWIPLIGNNKNELYEQKEALFFTGQLEGDSIPAECLRYTYPINRQFNFYKGEYNKGYYIFPYDLSLIKQVKDISGLKVRYVKFPQKDTFASISTIYDAQAYTLWYDLPNSLKNGGIYKAELLSDNKVIQAITFRVSNYNTIGEKIPGTGNISGFYDVDIPNAPYRPGYYLQFSYTSPLNYDEYFDNYENTGKNNDPLIRRRAILEECQWYKESYYKYIYDHYPVIPEAKLARDTSVTGIPPNTPIRIWQIANSRTLTDAEINSGSVTFTANFVHFMYTMPYYWKADYINTYNALHNKYSSYTEIKDTTLRAIYINSAIYSVKKGEYPFMIEYVLPGTNIVTSSKKVILTNSIGDVY